MMELNSKQRKFLEKAAHDLSPVVIIGASGLTDGIKQMTEDMNGLVIESTKSEEKNV